MTDITLLGVPIEDGAGRRGCAMGPAAYRTAGLAQDLAGLGHHVQDRGDLAPDLSGMQDDRLVRPAHVSGWSRALFRAARDLALQDTLPIYLGGDHALSIGSIAGHLAAAEIRGRPQFVLWLDAHADFNTPATSPSGNMHGTPLAYLTGIEDASALMGAPLPARLDPGNLCLLGLRSVDGPERQLLRGSGALAHDMRAIDEAGIGPLLRPFLDRVVAEGGLLHVSLDVDFLDPDIAPAVGTTVPGGATFREAHLVMEMLHDSGCVGSLDLVELNPFLDMRGRTTRLMVDLTASLFGRTVLDRPTTSY
ncbi:MAG: arginase [Marinibacterium sp.]|nr:arginase [Marinibacterium sp.]